MAELLLVGASRIATGQIYGAGRDGESNVIIDPRTHDEVARWDGPEVSFCTACGDSFLCISEKGLITRWDGKQIQTFSELAERSGRSLYRAATSLSPDSLVVVGDRGALANVDLRSRVAVVQQLGEYSVDRPGRGALCVAQVEGRVVLAGRKGLVAVLDSGGWRDVAPTLRSEVLFFSLQVARERVWLSGTLGATPVIAEAALDSDSIAIHSAPTESTSRSPRAPTLSMSGEELVVINRGVYLGTPNGWRRVGELEDDSAIAAFDDHSQRQITIVGYTGRCWSVSY